MGTSPVLPSIALGTTLVMGALWLLVRRFSRSQGIVLSQVPHLAADAQGHWLHLLGVWRPMLEYGDAVETWAHLMVAPRTGRWVRGLTARQEDVTWQSPLVADSLAALAGTLGWTPELARGGGKSGVSLQIAPVPTSQDGPARPCVATLHVDGATRGTHQFQALVASGFAKHILDADRVACFTYVGMKLGAPQAHLVVMDLDTGTVLWDRVCELAPG